MVGFLVLFSFIVLLSPQPVAAASSAQIDRDVKAALEDLYASSPAAKTLSSDAKAVLVFPDVVKAGLIVGGQFGEGSLLKNGATAGYYNTVAASYGLQAGAQKFGYALFFMSDKAVDFLVSSNGWEIGVGPSIVIVDEGVAKSLTTTTGRDEIYAFFFNQKGLMAGLGLQGSK
ncbi:MAG: lipid-binding SYLF domain-containing protein, partial [Desulfuromusa sp.]|nr:lipid-binding SYLF domain-containing protein [Desulfuromusa sp.]